jgi:hypothetical protein
MGGAGSGSDRKRPETGLGVRKVSGGAGSCRARGGQGFPGGRAGWPWEASGTRTGSAPGAMLREELGLRTCALEAAAVPPGGSGPGVTRAGSLGPRGPLQCPTGAAPRVARRPSCLSRGGGGGPRAAQRGCVSG